MKTDYYEELSELRIENQELKERIAQLEEAVSSLTEPDKKPKLMGLNRFLTLEAMGEHIDQLIKIARQNCEIGK